MRHPLSTMPLLLALFAGTTALAQEDPGAAEQAEHPCSVRPIFHCATLLADGSAIGHFGYSMQCPGDPETVPDLSIPIGEDNYFSPDPEDRGQPITFMPGRHIDEFEAEFTAEERKKAGDLHWQVKKISTRVDFSKARDEELDCTQLSY